MDALKWMGAVRMRADKNSTPVHQLTSEAETNPALRRL